MRRLTATVGRPDTNAFHDAIASATNVAELEKVVHGAIGSSDLMEFARFDAGEVLRKLQGGHGPKILRLVVGNPLIMKEMAKTVPDAASYAPVTILVDQRRRSPPIVRHDGEFARSLRKPVSTHGRHGSRREGRESAQDRCEPRAEGWLLELSGNEMKFP